MEHENEYEGDWEWLVGLCAGGGNGLAQHRGPLETVGGGVTRREDLSAVVRGPHSLCPGWIEDPTVV